MQCIKIIDPDESLELNIDPVEEQEILQAMDDPISVETNKDSIKPDHIEVTADITPQTSNRKQKKRRVEESQKLSQKTKENVNACIYIICQ